jgi:divinyl protochlorophyllide a 8-vinyl-reductase
MHSARIGPNAITRVAEALLADVGASLTVSIFDRAGLEAYLAKPPQQMVDETEVARLHLLLREALDTATARRVAIDAGHRTGDYLLAHRIPGPLQWILRVVPAPIACRLLLSAIGRHAWTFAGSGQFRSRVGDTVMLEITDNPMCRGSLSAVPVCDYYAATFERLFRVLVHPRASVVELACEATGAKACLFEVRW